MFTCIHCQDVCAHLWSQRREDWAGCSPECCPGSHPRAATRSWGAGCRRAGQDGPSGAPRTGRTGCSRDWRTTETEHAFILITFSLSNVKLSSEGQSGIPPLCLQVTSGCVLFWTIWALERSPSSQYCSCCSTSCCCSAATADFTLLGLCLRQLALISWFSVAWTAGGVVSGVSSS